jgi:D-alanyl-D-alanine-carboxypeptidase/D-alanyl-D-alanine-endopeptidase
MTRARFLLFLLLLFWLTSVFAAAQETAPVSLPDVAGIDSLGSDLYLQSGSTGIVLVVVRGQQTYFHGYGETAPGSHRVPDMDSVVRICSLTKIFTTDLLTKLVADKTVRLDDPLQKYAPKNRPVPKRVKPITLLDLATHTSGLPRELGTAPSPIPHFTFPDSSTRWLWLPNQHLRSVPGTAALYSNIGFDFLADAIQGATHKQYAALLSERTLIPLHMWSTTYFPTAEQCSRLLVGAKDERACAETEATDGSSGLYSSPRDMAIWLKYLLGVGAPEIPAQDPTAQAIYITPADLISQRGLDHAGEPTGVGLGWIHILPVDSPSTIVEKTGGGAGFETYIAINRATKTAIFVAATGGPFHTHLNLFNAANKMLLAVAGLPPLPPPPEAPVATHIRPRARPHRQRSARR